MDFLQEPSKANEVDEQVAEAVEDIVAHMVHVDNINIENASVSTRAGNYQELFSHFARLDDSDGPVFFVARMQGAAFLHLTIASIPTKIFEEKFKWMLGDTGSAR